MLNNAVTKGRDGRGVAVRRVRLYHLLDLHRGAANGDERDSRMTVKGRTVRQIQAGAEIWDAADKWAAMSGYELRGQDQTSRLYQRGTGFWVAPQMVRISSAQGGYVLEAWIRVPMLNRILALGLMPEEIIIDKGGFVAVIPRNRAREDVNKLLVSLNAPAIT